MKWFALLLVLLLTGCTAGLGSEVVTEEESISVAQENAVEAAISAAAARDVPFVNENPTASTSNRAELDDQSVANTAEALRFEAGYPDLEDAVWTLTYVEDIPELLQSINRGRAFYVCLYQGGAGAQFSLALDAVTGAVAAAAAEWPESLSTGIDTACSWVQGSEAADCAERFARAMGLELADEAKTPGASDVTDLSAATRELMYSTADGRRVLVVVDGWVRQAVSLSYQPEVPNEKLSAGGNIWWEKAPDGDYYIEVERRSDGIYLLDTGKRLK